MKITIIDVAKMAGVSVTAVSQSLNNVPGARISDKTRKKILETSKKLNYRPSFAARSFVLQKSFNIGLIVCHNPGQYSVFAPSFYAFAAVQSIQDTAKKSGYNISLFLASNLKEFNYKALFKEKRVDGLIVLQTVFADLKILEADPGIGRFPIIILNNRLPNTKLNYIDIDNKSGIFQTVEHLVKLGYKKIGFTGGPQNQSNFIERCQAYKMALKKYGLQFDPGIFVEDPSEIDKFLATGNLPEAIIASNDASAIKTIQAIRKRGLSVPDDVAVVGFDDMEIARHLDPLLTTVRQPWYKIGVIATEELINLIESKGEKKQVKRILDTELVVRESCGAKLKWQSLEVTEVVGAVA